MPRIVTCYPTAGEVVDGRRLVTSWPAPIYRLARSEARARSNQVPGQRVVASALAYVEGASCYWDILTSHYVVAGRRRTCARADGQRSPTYGEASDGPTSAGGRLNHRSVLEPSANEIAAKRAGPGADGAKNHRATFGTAAAIHAAIHGAGDSASQAAKCQSPPRTRLPGQTFA